MPLSKFYNKITAVSLDDGEKGGCYVLANHLVPRIKQDQYGFRGRSKIFRWGVQNRGAKHDWGCKIGVQNMTGVYLLVSGVIDYEPHGLIPVGG